VLRSAPKTAPRCAPRHASSTHLPWRSRLAARIQPACRRQGRTATSKVRCRSSPRTSLSHLLANFGFLRGSTQEELRCRLNAGETFYNLLADRLGNAAAADLLRKNAREERGHAERLRRALALKLGGTWEPQASDLAPFALALPDRVSAELLAGIVQGELQGDAGYQRWADAEPDAEVQRLLRQNGREETVHAGRVTEAIALLG
jgi:hypothetical protein